MSVKAAEFQIVDCERDYESWTARHSINFTPDEAGLKMVFSYAYNLGATRGFDKGCDYMENPEEYPPELGTKRRDSPDWPEHGVKCTIPANP